MAICIVERWKKSMGYQWSQGQEIHTCPFFRFLFSAIFAGPQFVEIKKCCDHGNVT